MKKELKADIAWGGGVFLIALAATGARQLGYIDEETVLRVTMGAIGLMLAWYGNRMPKALVSGACERQVTRVGGWAMALSGLVYAGLWAFAPTDTAMTIGTAAIAAGVVVTVGYSLWLRGRTRAA